MTDFLTIPERGFVEAVERESWAAALSLARQGLDVGRACASISIKDPLLCVALMDSKALELSELLAPFRFEEILESRTSNPLLAAAHLISKLSHEGSRAPDPLACRVFQAVLKGGVDGFAGSPERLAEFLNQEDDYGWTPLMLCALAGYPEGARALLAAGADPNIQADEGCALGAAHSSNSGSSMSMLWLLLEAGADPGGPIVLDSQAPVLLRDLSPEAAELVDNFLACQELGASLPAGRAPKRPGL